MTTARVIIPGHCKQVAAVKTIVNVVERLLLVVLSLIKVAVAIILTIYDPASDCYVLIAVKSN